MRRSRKNKKTKLYLLIILGLTIGFALVSTTLYVNGVITFNPRTYDIHWDDNTIEVTEGSRPASTPAHTTDETKKTISFAAQLDFPGDYYEFTVDAKNYGDVDGTIGTIILKYYNGDTGEEMQLPEDLEFIVTYADGGVPQAGDVLKAGRTKKYRVRFAYKSSVTELKPITPVIPEMIIPVNPTKSVCPNPTTFTSDDWDTIACNVKRGKTENYNVGDTKTVDLGTYGTHTVRLANKSTPNDCNASGYSQTACGFVVEFEDIITEHYMGNGNTITNVGGWPATVLRNYLNTDIFNAFPESLKGDILDTFVVSSHGNADSNDFQTYDKLYLLSRKEIWGAPTDSTQFDTGMDKTRQLDYYKEKGVGLTTNREFVIKKYNNNNKTWWQRSALYSSNQSFSTASSWGNYDYDNDTLRDGVSPAFRLG